MQKSHISGQPQSTRQSRSRAAMSSRTAAQRRSRSRSESRGSSRTLRMSVSFSLSPEGRGRGEGARASRSEPPHPNPLPAGERGLACASPRHVTARVSFHFDRGGLHLRRAGLVGPGERERAALGGDGEERDVGIGGNGGIKRGVKNFLAVIGADEIVDDVARDRLAGDADAVAGFHHVRDQRLDLDDLAFLGGGRNVDQGAGHQGFGSSTQAASVTMTSMSSDQNEPSDSSAIAVTFCESASRIRVEKLARPARGPSLTLITFGCGFFSLKTWIALT